MLADLQRLKLDLYLVAERDGLVSRCYELGRRWGIKGRWQGEGIDLMADESQRFVTVASHGKLVLCSHPLNFLYLPGPWADHLDVCYRKLKDEDR